MIDKIAFRNVSTVDCLPVLVDIASHQSPGFVEWGFRLDNPVEAAAFSERILRMGLPGDRSCDFALHVSGSAAIELIKHNDPQIAQIARSFDRLQLNVSFDRDLLEALDAFLLSWNDCEVILHDPANANALRKVLQRHGHGSLLFDFSLEEATYPFKLDRAFASIRSGFAGEFGVSNLERALRSIDGVVGVTEPYWVEMDCSLEHALACVRIAAEHHFLGQT